MEKSIINKAFVVNIYIIVVLRSSFFGEQIAAFVLDNAGVSFNPHEGDIVLIKFTEEQFPEIMVKSLFLIITHPTVITPFLSPTFIYRVSQ